MTVKSEFLCDMRLDIPPGYQIAGIATGTRMVAPFVGGSFSGPRFSGTVLPGGGDWMLIGADGVMRIDVRGILQVDDGTMIHMSYGGRIAIPPQHMEKLFNPETVESVDPADYYFRSTPVLDVPIASPHAWLNGKVMVGVGRLLKAGVAYKIHTIE